MRLVAKSWVLYTKVQSGRISSMAFHKVDIIDWWINTSGSSTSTTAPGMA